MTALEAYKKVTFAAVKKTGNLVSKEVAEKRIDICQACPYAGQVSPLPFLTVEGCTLCGCPFATKPHMLTMAGKKITCPHPDGDKWADIDKTQTKTKQ